MSFFASEGERRRVSSVSRVVLDASALLALLNAESGSQAVAERLSEAAVSAVNLSEVVAKLSERGIPESEIRSALDGLGLEIIAFDETMAYRAGLLRRATRSVGLSLGDRACLALALQLEAPAFTTDRSWKTLRIGVKVRAIR
jgi:PIN domain nuclease of toxin-antitoxin system